MRCILCLHSGLDNGRHFRSSWPDGLSEEEELYDDGRTPHRDGTSAVERSDGIGADQSCGVGTRLARSTLKPAG